jgi:hypothetical protein
MPGGGDEAAEGAKGGNGTGAAGRCKRQTARSTHKDSQYRVISTSLGNPEVPACPPPVWQHLDNTIVPWQGSDSSRRWGPPHAAAQRRVARGAAPRMSPPQPAPPRPPRSLARSRSKSKEGQRSQCPRAHARHVSINTSESVSRETYLRPARSSSSAWPSGSSGDAGGGPGEGRLHQREGVPCSRYVTHLLDECRHVLLPMRF